MGPLRLNQARRVFCVSISVLLFKLLSRATTFLIIYDRVRHSCFPPVYKGRCDLLSIKNLSVLSPFVRGLYRTMSFCFTSAYRIIYDGPSIRLVRRTSILKPLQPAEGGNAKHVFIRLVHSHCNWLILRFQKRVVHVFPGGRKSETPSTHPYIEQSNCKTQFIDQDSMMKPNDMYLFSKVG